MKNKNDSRRAFLDFCDTVRNTERDKDRFLDAAKLQRHERLPTFTAGQIIGLAVVLCMLLLGCVAIICMTLAGKTNCIIPALGGTLLTVLFAAMLVLV